MKHEKQLKSIDARELAEVRGGTFYPLPWVERYEPTPEPWLPGTSVPIVQVGVLQAH